MSIKTIFLTVFGLCLSVCGMAQVDTSRLFVEADKARYEMVDSVKIFFIGATSSREKFKFYYYGKLIFFVKVKNSFNHSFSLKNVKVWYGDDLAGFHIFRKGRYGLKFRDTGQQISYEPHKYLIIKKNPWLKNRFAVDHYWSDTKPPARINLGKIYHKIN